MKPPKLDPDSPYADLTCTVIGGYLRGTVAVVVDGEKRRHPIADGRGRVRLHRAVLWDAIGAGPHVCRWCGWDGLRWDAPRNDPDYLVVDHVDGDSYNNVSANLVPAHAWCNNNRGVVERLGIPWETIAETAAGDRPNLRGYGGAPNAAALELAGRTADLDDVTTDVPSPPPSSSPPASPDAITTGPPDPRRSWWRRRAAAAHPAGSNRIVTWETVAELDGDGQVAEPIRLLRPWPAELEDKYPQLRKVKW